MACLQTQLEVLKAAGRYKVLLDDAVQHQLQFGRGVAELADSHPLQTSKVTRWVMNKRALLHIKVR